MVLKLKLISRDPVKEKRNLDIRHIRSYSTMPDGKKDDGEMRFFKDVRTRIEEAQVSLNASYVKALPDFIKEAEAEAEGKEEQRREDDAKEGVSLKKDAKEGSVVALAGVSGAENVDAFWEEMQMAETRDITNRAARDEERKKLQQEMIVQDRLERGQKAEARVFELTQKVREQELELEVHRYGSGGQGQAASSSSRIYGDWVEAWDEGQQAVFYMNTKTEESSWELPEGQELTSQGGGAQLVAQGATDMGMGTHEYYRNKLEEERRAVVDLVALVQQDGALDGDGEVDADSRVHALVAAAATQAQELASERSRVQSLESRMMDLAAKLSAFEVEKDTYRIAAVALAKERETSAYWKQRCDDLEEQSIRAYRDLNGLGSLQGIEIPASPSAVVRKPKVWRYTTDSPSGP
jgi:hypothetical protein